MSARYFRNRTGQVVHREGCPSQPPFPTWWNWAEGKTISEIEDEAAAVRLSFTYCKKCIGTVVEVTAPDDEDYELRPALGRTHPYGGRSA